MSLLSDCDRHFLGYAIDLAARQLGRVAPNPAVGCVLVQPSVSGRSGADSLGQPKPLATGVTAAGGRPHAETQAIAQARAGGYALQGATAFVSLEPCCHHGKTPPCTEALIAAGIQRVVVALLDPDPRVSGKGIASLRQAGIAVDLCHDEALTAAASEVILGFSQRITTGRPMVTLKLATSLDGKIATALHESQWITGAMARHQSHLLRARHDAIMVGTATVLADNPRLTVRLPGLERFSPLKVILDRQRRIPLEYHIFSPPALLVSGKLQAEEREFFRAREIQVAELFEGDRGSETSRSTMMHRILKRLGEAGHNSVLVEGGGKLAANLLDHDLVDRLVWFRAPVILGEGGIPAVAHAQAQKLADYTRWQVSERRPVGDDYMEILKPIRRTD